MSNKYSQKLLDGAKESTINAIKTASKRAIQEIAEATGDLICSKIADKITSISKHFSQKHEANNEMEILKEIYMSLEKRQRIIDELGLV